MDHVTGIGRGSMDSFICDWWVCATRLFEYKKFIIVIIIGFNKTNKVEGVLGRRSLRLSFMYSLWRRQKTAIRGK